MLQQTSFKETQKKYPRVREAYQEKETHVKQLFIGKKLSYKNFELFIRAFKQEQILEVWIKESGQGKFSLLHTYDFCTTSGVLGPKRKEGDLQIPEGAYYISHFNPASNFHLSLGLNYPNASDRILSDKSKPGGDIYIHGNCVTIGCIPITDDKIKELYILAVEAKSGGQEKIPVHIFPTKLDDTSMNQFKNQYEDAPTLLHFWENLKFVFDDFEATKKIRPVGVRANGSYYLK